MKKIIPILLSAFLLARGIYSFVDTGKASDNLKDSASKLESYFKTTNDQYLAEARNSFSNAKSKLDNHWHIFPIDPRINTLSTSDFSDSSSSNLVSRVKKVESAYRGPGNCPVVKLVFPCLLFLGVLGYAKRRYSE
jgi:hypothetical protein